MSKLVGPATEALRGAVRAAMEAAIADGTLPQADLPEFALEVPADRAHGDWACNAAMVECGALSGQPPENCRGNRLSSGSFGFLF